MKDTIEDKVTEIIDSNFTIDDVAGSGITINSLEDAKSIDAIATTTAWGSEIYLKDQNFTNLVSDALPTTSVQKLMDGNVSLSIFNDLTVANIIDEAGYNISDVEKVYNVMQATYYIAISKGTSEEVYQQWSDALKAIKDDGKFEEIYHQYFPDGNLSDLLEI